MPYIHARADWPRFTWDDAALSAGLAKTRHRQGYLLGRMKGLGFNFQSQASLESIAAEVLHSSAIEGTQFEPSSVRSSVARHMGLEAEETSAPSRELEGAVEMMLDATQQASKPLTSERLWQWQASLFPAGQSGMRRVLTGKWRTPESDPMQVVSGPLNRDRIRRKHIHFEAPPAARIPGEMKRFLDWFEHESALDAVLKAGIAHLWFLTIHPFEDGNGRVARALTELVLSRAEGSGLRFYSPSKQIEHEKRAYYQALEAAQRGSLDITPWLGWFINCLGRALDSAEQSLVRILRKAAVWTQINAGPALSERQRRVVNHLLASPQTELSTSAYAKIARCSLDTALRDISALLETGILAKGEAGGRSTRYRLP